MIKRLSLGIAAALCAGSVFASGDGLYGGLELGTGWDNGFYNAKNRSLTPTAKIRITGENNYLLGGVVGYQTGPFRIEGEINGRTSEADKIRVNGATSGLRGKLHANSIMLNGYYSFDMQQNWRPFITGGLGRTEFSLRGVKDDFGNRVSKSNSDFAWQLGGGLEWKVSRNIVGEAKYRYHKAPEIKIDHAKGEFHNHEATLGFRYKF